MSYSNRSPMLAQEALNGTMTATASDHVVTVEDAGVLPEFFNSKRINDVKAVITTAPNAGATGVTLNFLNGTATFASIAIGTNTAGEVVAATMTDANTQIAEGVEPTVNLVGTATASENTDMGTYNIWFDLD